VLCKQDKTQTDESDREAAALTVLRLCQANFHILFGHRVLSVSKRPRKGRPGRCKKEHRPSANHAVDYQTEEAAHSQIMRALQHSIRTMGFRACPSPYVFFSE
jgi:hypothetical protein